jgi:hypothetical protein
MSYPHRKRNRSLYAVTESLKEQQSCGLLNTNLSSEPTILLQVGSAAVDWLREMNSRTVYKNLHYSYYIYISMYWGALSPGVKRPGHEADHSPPTSAEVKKMWIYTSIPHTPSWCGAQLD